MADIRQRYKPLDYTLYSATVPRDGEQVVVFNSPGYAAARRVIYMGDGVSTIAELVEAGAIGVQDAQIKTQNTGTAYTNQYAKLFTVELDTQGDYNDIRISWAASGSGATSAEFCETLFRVEQVAAFGNDPVISGKLIGLGADLTKFSFWYTIVQNTPTTVVDVYAQIEADNYELYGYVLSATFPETTTFNLLADFEATLTGEVEFAAGSISASLNGTADVANAFPTTTGSAPVVACRAFCNVDCTTSADVSGTYVRTGTSVVVTYNNHGYLVGHRLFADFTSGTATDGLFTITAVDTNTFTFTHGTSGNTSGNITIKRWKINTQVNIHDIYPYAAASNSQIGGNFTVPLPDQYYSIFGTPVYTSFIQWCNEGVMTKEYFTLLARDAGGTLASANNLSNITVLR